MMTSSQDSPSVSGTNRKWYIAVTANCRRETSTSAMSGSMGSLFKLLSGSRRNQHARHAVCIHAVAGGHGEPDGPDQVEYGELDREHQRKFFAQRAARSRAVAFMIVCHGVRLVSFIDS